MDGVELCNNIVISLNEEKQKWAHGHVYLRTVTDKVQRKKNIIFTSPHR